MKEDVTVLTSAAAQMTSDLDPILADLETAIRGATVKIESRRVELCNLGDIESAKTECKVSNLFTACQPSYCGLTALLFLAVANVFTIGFVI